MFTVVANHESVDAAGAQNDLTPAAGDATVRIVGDRTFVPGLNKVALLAAGVAIGGNGTARLESPELLKLGRHYIQGVNGRNDGSVVPNATHVIEDLRSQPLALVVGEGFLATVHSDSTAAALQWVVTWFADGPIAPVVGPHFTTRLTGTTTAVSRTWTLCPLTFDENIPRGRYAIIGMRAMGATCVAARLIIPGQPNRPGVLGCTAGSDLGWDGFRHGQLGEFGQWEDTDAMQAEFLCNAADTAQTVFLDLLPVRLGPG
jgi:hypothetical protein